MKKFFSSVIFLAAVIGFSFFAMNLVLGGATGAIPKEGGQFTVEPGWSTGEIARALRNEGFIRSDYYFRALTRLMRMDGNLQAGSYHIPANLSSIKILKLLASGKTQLIRVTVPEGLTSRKVALLFQEAGITSSEEFLAATKNKELLSEFGIIAPSAEGFLFPDTYMMAKPYPAEKVVRTMIRSFFREMDQIYPEYKQMPWSEFYNRLILSSIVEKEYRVDEEAPKIASVFYNRLERDIALESCASVVYVLTEVLGREHPKRLFYKDLEVDHPYNAYRNKGLPPGPIANAGPVALKATFEPAQTDYLFFVVQNAQKGTHLFSNNLADHEAGRKRYVETYFPK